MHIVVDNLLTTYERTGTGKKTVLLLHGWGDTHKTFTTLQSQLSKEHDVISLDLPGFGATQAPAVTWGLEDYALFVRKFIEKLGINSLYVCVGHSNGAALAIKAVSHGILKPEKIILIGAAGIRNTLKARKLALKAIAKTGKVATIWLPEQQKKRLRKKLYGVAGSDLLVAPHLQETFKKTVAEDVQKDAAKLQIPTLLIYGELDRATPVAYGQIYKQLISDSRLEVLNGAEHLVHHDQPEKVAKLIEDFIR